MTNQPFTHHFFQSDQADAPVLLLLHGTGGDENDLIPLGRELLPGAHLLSPRGQVLENGMPRYFRRLAEGVFDLEDLRLRTRELAEFVSWAREAYNLTTNPIYAVGYSNGANIAANLLLTEPSTLQGAVLFRALLPTQPATMPNLAQVPVLLLAGEHDQMISKQGTDQLVHALQSAQATLTVQWMPTGHQLSNGDVQLATRWLTELAPRETHLPS
jgi:predicted esterase